MLAIRNKRIFRFVYVSAKLLGMIEISLQPPDNIPPIHILFDVVDVAISALIDLYALDINLLMIDKTSNRLCHRILVLNDQLQIVDK